jgi:hypothetical protein
MVISWDLIGIYPLVNLQKAIEHGNMASRNSGFNQKK